MVVEKRIGESVSEGEPLLRVICDDTAKGNAVVPMLAGAYTIGEERVEPPPMIIRRMD